METTAAAAAFAPPSCDMLGPAEAVAVEGERGASVDTVNLAVLIFSICAEKNLGFEEWNVCVCFMPLRLLECAVNDVYKAGKWVSLCHCVNAMASLFVYVESMV